MDTAPKLVEGDNSGSAKEQTGNGTIEKLRVRKENHES